MTEEVKSEKVKRQITFKEVKDKDYLTLDEAVIYSKGEYKLPRLRYLFQLQIIPAFKRHRERPWIVARWILDAHRRGLDVSNFDARVSEEEFKRLLAERERG